jgi:hypothetical protein
MISISSTTTVVSAWYNISSKFNADIYRKWFQNFFKIPCNLVLFTDLKSRKDFSTLTQEQDCNCNIIVLELEMQDFVVSKFDKFWEYCLCIDVEKQRGVNHSVELYKVWAEKAFFVKRAIELNPFKSSIFCWSDLGAVRSDDMFPSIYSFPLGLDKYIEESKVLFSQIEPFTKSDFVIEQNGISKTFQNCSPVRSCDSVIRIQGGFFAGSSASLTAYADMYLQELTNFADHSVFAGKDQYVMANLLLKFGSLFFNVLPRDNKTYHNEWFSYLTRCSMVPKVTTLIQGGLGNQMFQVAAALATAWKNGAFATFAKQKPTGSNNITDRPGYWDSMFRRVFSSNNVSFQPAMVLEEMWNHQCRDLTPITRDTLLKGYFQSSFYFRDYKERIKALFGPDKEQLQWVQQHQRRTVGMHIRRSDYVKLGWNLPESYYNDCLLKCKAEPADVVIFTDDVEWCEQHFPYCAIFEAQGNSTPKDVLDLFSFSSCKTMILANSSYSWWAAFLNDSENKTVFYPSPWFKNENYNDKIAEPDWIAVKW